MHPKSIGYLASLLLLASCGGGGSDAVQPSVNLQGLWYEAFSNPPIKYTDPFVISQNGSDVVIKSCDWSTLPLKLHGDRLVQADGQDYYLQPRGEDSLSGYNVRTPVNKKRLSTTAQFDSGRVSLNLPSAAPFQASQDVCAQKVYQSYPRNDGVEWIASGAMVTAPYMGSHVQLKLLFDQTQALRPGDFVARDRASFVQTPAGSVHVEVTSPAFVGTYGRNTLESSAGQVRVRSIATGAYAFEGTVTTTTGAQILLNSEVVIERQP